MGGNQYIHLMQNDQCRMSCWSSRFTCFEVSNLNKLYIISRLKLQDAIFVQTWDYTLNIFQQKWFFESYAPPKKTAMALCQLVHGWSADWPIPLAGTWLPQIATGPCVLGPGTKALNCHNRFGVSCLKVHLRKETTLSLGTSLNYHQTIARLYFRQ